MASAGIRAILLEIDDDLIDFDGLEARYRNVELLIDEKLGEFRQFDGKAFPIPAGVIGDLVISQDQCALLSLAQPSEHDHRHLVEVEIDSSRKATVPQQDCVVFIDYDRDHEAEGENAVGDLADLLLGMGPCVTGIGFEPKGRHPLDLMHNELLSRSSRGAQRHPGPAVVVQIWRNSGSDRVQLVRVASLAAALAAVGDLKPLRHSALLLPVRRALPAGLMIQTLQRNVVPRRRQDVVLRTHVQIPSRKQQLAPKVKPQVEALWRSLTGRSEKLGR